MNRHHILRAGPDPLQRVKGTPRLARAWMTLIYAFVKPSAGLIIRMRGAKRARTKRARTKRTSPVDNESGTGGKGKDSTELAWAFDVRSEPPPRGS